MKLGKSQTITLILTSLAIGIGLSGVGMFIGARKAEQQADQLRAEVMGRHLLSSVRNYNLEYRKYPVPVSGTPPEYRGMVDTALLGALTGTDTAANPRGVMFLGSSRLEGLTRTAGVWACQDPWGGEYEIQIWAPNSAQPHALMVTVTSKGPDGIRGTRDDIEVGK